MPTFAYDVYTISPQFDDALLTILRQINKQEWLTPLKYLAHNFDQLPQILDVSFEAELLTVMYMISHAYVTDQSAPLIDIAIIRISKILSFSVRGAKRLDDKMVYWHPMEQSWVSFDSADAHISQQPDPYPTQDMIKRWLRDHLQ